MFQPSTSTRDWIINIGGFLSVLKFPFFYCFGWKTVYDNCKGIIFEEVAREMNTHKGYPLEICGHSYGGAMSIIAGIDIARNTGTKPNVITFGSPMPLVFFPSKLLAKLYLGEVVQYAHWSDIVTYCPPLIGYHNVKVKRIGKFSIKNLFNPNVYHMIYDDESLYEL